MVRWNNRHHQITNSFFLLRVRLVFWLGLGDSFVSQSPREFQVSFSFCLYCQILVSWTVPSRSPFPYSRAQSCIFHVIYPGGLSIMFFLFPYFTPKLFCFLCIPFFGLSSCILHLLVGRIFFRYFRISYFMYITWLCRGIFWVSLFLPRSFDLSLQVVFPICRLLCFGLFIPTLILLCFSFPFMFFFPFHLLSQFLYLSFYPNFPSRFRISVQVP